MLDPNQTNPVTNTGNKSGSQGPQQPIPTPNVPSSSANVSMSKSSSEEHFDIDKALETVPEATPTPEPVIKPNPRHEQMSSVSTPTSPNTPQASGVNQKPTTISMTSDNNGNATAPTPSTPPVTPPAPTSEDRQPPTPRVPIAPTPTTDTTNTTTVAKKPADATSTTPPKAPRTINTNKRGKRLGIVGFMIGCGIFMVLLIAMGAFVLYSMLTNPETVWTIISRESGELLLKTFAGLFFGLLSLFGMIFIFVNLFRITQKKYAKKIKYVGGMIGGLLMLGAGLGAGIPTISLLNNLSVGSAQTDMLVIPSVVMGAGEGLRPLTSVDTPLLIAPTKIVFELNPTIYQTQITRLGIQTTPLMTLRCGNGQEFLYDGTSNSFGPCYFTTQGDYPISVVFEYVDRSTGQQVEQVFDIGAFNVGTQIILRRIDGDESNELTTNTDQDELIAGIAPTKIQFDAQSVITDYNLPTNDIERDIDGDGEFERIEDVFFTHSFVRSQLHQIAYRLPSLSPHTYALDLRVQQSDVPICIVSVTPQANMSYDLDVDFVDLNTSISRYGYEIIDQSAGRRIDIIQSALASESYDFTTGGTYAVKASFITADGKRGSCESDNFRVGDVPYEIDFDFTIQGPDEREASDPTQSDIVSINEEENTLTLTTIPVTIRVDVSDIRPRRASVRPLILYNDAPALSSDDQSFVVTIDSPGDHEIQVGAIDDLTNERTIVQTYQLSVQLEAIEGELIAQPDVVGDEPFVVTLDASTVRLNDPNDEIIYFTRDFDDGEIKRNINTGRIEHTYYFDTERESGVYQPTAEITTKLGRTMLLELPTPITVKRALRFASVAFESHPAQLARVGESVDISMTADGIPSTIVRDLGDGSTQECSDRSCANITYRYLDAGTYDVQVSVSYDDHPTITANATLVVQ